MKERKKERKKENKRGGKTLLNEQKEHKLVSIQIIG